MGQILDRDKIALPMPLVNNRELDIPLPSSLAPRAEGQGRLTWHRSWSFQAQVTDRRNNCHAQLSLKRQDSEQSRNGVGFRFRFRFVSIFVTSISILYFRTFFRTKQNQPIRNNLVVLSLSSTSVSNASSTQYRSEAAKRHHHRPNAEWRPR